MRQLRLFFISWLIGIHTILTCIALHPVPAGATEPPAAPANFHAGWVSAQSVFLQWNDVAGETKYELYVNGQLHANLMQNQTARQVSGLTPLTHYTFSIRACAENGSLCSNLTTLNLDTAAPLTPANFRALTITSSYAHLAWDAVPGATSYMLRKNGEIVLNIPSPTTNFQVSGLNSNTSYLFEIQGCVSTGCGGSAMLFVLTRSCVSDTAQFSPLISEGDISGEINQQYVFNGWQSSPWWGISLYRWWFSDTQQEAIGDIVTHTFSTPGSHQVFLRVEDFCGHISPWISIRADISNPSSPQSCPGNNPPVALLDETNISARVGFTTTVPASSSYDPEGQIIDLRVLLDGSPISAWQTSPYINHTWSASEQGFHSLQVQARDGCGFVSTSAAGSVSVLPPLPPVPPAPANFRLSSATQTSVTLAWDAVPSTPGYTTSYEVTLIGGNIIYTTSTNYTRQGLTAGQPYTFTLRACNTSGCSAIGDATTLGVTTLPAAPGTLSASSVGTSSANLTWSQVTGESFFELRLNGALIATPGQNQTSYLLSGLQAATSYAVTVRACNTGGCSGNAATNFTTASGSYIPPGSGGIICPSSGKGLMPQASFTNGCPLDM